MFSENGYVGTSLSNIAKEVGITKAAIYSHFKSKEELYLEVVDKEINTFSLSLDEYIKVLPQELSREPLKEVLYEYIENILDYACGDDSKRRFWAYLMFFPTYCFKDIISEKMDSYKDRHLKIQRIIFEWGIEKGEIKDIDIDNLVYAFSSLIEGNIALLLYTDIFSYEKLRFNFELYWESIKNNRGIKWTSK